MLQAHKPHHAHDEANGQQSQGQVKAGKVELDNVDKDREVQEGETLVEHLLHYTKGAAPALLALFLLSCSTDETILRDEILNIGLAGRDSTSCLLTFVIYMLTEHPAVFAKLRAEVMDRVGPTRAPTSDDIREMKYLRAVLNGLFRHGRSS